MDEFFFTLNDGRTVKVSINRRELSICLARHLAKDRKTANGRKYPTKVKKCDGAIVATVA
jgi:hypothetical protein